MAQQDGDQKPPEGAEADEGADDAVEQQDAVEGDERDEDGDKQDGKGDTGRDDKAGSFDELLKSLPAEQRKLVKAEMDRRDGDTRKARTEARNLRDRVRSAEPKAQQYDAALDAQKTAEQKAADELAESRTENGALRQRLVTQEIRVQAAAKFADADDPADLLAGRVKDLLGEDGEPDKQAIGDALDDLLSRKPHLGKPDPTPRPPRPAKGQGSSGGPAPTADSQVAERRKAGDFTGAIGLELQKLGGQK